ncbi:tRNA (adenosine(37)-N6)-threonylcarbamoyltransferase complex dimerization subunit type 1 TsaB [Alteromonas sp. ASW11-19]|uniref:tRNA threonylcarbamoyladenosine biosynthesis protein TsaB n=1 Tax=Alteromonas salexigens TaxID=2982530 RepID=A0ABT2VRQ8_9ALTE|nr:tRNA (adenosine(37)-N6)-threonylcarbamoyltransferase complex dimerization subunit type 1 TsaB [Alteromonas salexigens]MCU7555981.1 tRNA (adenosine(37)-N6)-threonylcarbamoyltransferase complex dimerization subunit type 1 TsaB [Alteromonas salexigens]
MSRILAIDTATEACSVAVKDGNKVYSQFEVCPQQHSQKLLPMVDAVLSEAGLTLTDIDCLAYGRGPGSFTGVRIATGMIQGLAFGSERPVAGVSTLAAMAQQAMQESGKTTAYVAIDARMGEVYFAAFTLNDGLAESLTDEQVCAPEAAATQLEQPNAVLAGTGWDAYAVLNEYKEQHAAEVVVLYPNAEAMLPLAERLYQQGGAVTAGNVEPVYLRDKVTWKKLPGRE